MSSILRDIRTILDKIERSKPVVVYQPAIEPNTAYVVKGDLFPDGKKRLLIHPSHEETIETWLATR